MTMGIGIALVVIGAILTFALHFNVAGISIMTIGDILMIAGAVVFLISLVLTLSRRRAVSTSRTSVDAAGNTVKQQETIS